MYVGGIVTRLRDDSRDVAANLDSPYSAHLSANSWIESAAGAAALKRLDLPAIRWMLCHHALESDLASASTTASICLVTWSLQSLRACLLRSGLKRSLTLLTSVRDLQPCTWLLLSLMMSSASWETSRLNSFGFLSRGRAVPAFLRELCILPYSSFAFSRAATSAAWSVWSVGGSSEPRSRFSGGESISAVACGGFRYRWGATGVAGSGLV